MLKTHSGHAGVWLLGLLLVGCSGGQLENSNWPKRFPTSGTVLYQGKPIEGAEVTFTDKAGTSTGVGKTDSSGQFYLTTHIEKDGAVAGPQIVSIRRVEVIDKTPKDVDVSAGGVALPPEIKWIIPEKYSIPAKSGLTAEVTEAGPNDFKFDLK
jgi:hypothetical protein